MILENLNFLSAADLSDERIKKYNLKTPFEQLCTKTKAINTANTFLIEFVTHCENIYREATGTEELLTKTAVHMLLEEVSKKYATYWERKTTQDALLSRDR